MQYYIKEQNGVILDYAKKEDIDSGVVKLDYTGLIDYEPLQWNNLVYTQEKFEEIKKTEEYKQDQKTRTKNAFDFESKEMENDALYVEYKGKKISLDEILFKSLFYSSVTDLFVYLRAEDKTIIKMLRTSFLLLITKAKLNLKATEEALYNAQQNYDPSKTLEESIQALKSVLDSIDKIFND